MKAFLAALCWTVGSMQVEPESFRKRLATYSKVTDHIAIANSDPHSELIITLSGNNSFYYNGPTTLSFPRLLEDQECESQSYCHYADHPFPSMRTLRRTHSRHGPIHGFSDAPTRLDSVEEIARQIKAGRAVGILAKLTEEGFKSLQGQQQQASCGLECTLNELTSKCKSQIYASEHLRLFSVTFEPHLCTLKDIVFVLSLLTANPNVDFMEVDGVVEVHKLQRQPPLHWPNDPLVLRQWALPYLKIPQAWALVNAKKLNHRPIVMIIDTGVDYNHPDIKPNMWINEKELHGKPGVDDDENGYVDDIYGINSHDGTGDPMDEDGHGTHCAGIIGAMANNSRGVAGVNWGPKIMACRFIVKDSGTYSDAIKCVDYAIRMGANIISNSWGGGPESNILKSAIERAASKNIFFVISSGNTGKDLDATPVYPASYRLSNSITIGAVDEKGVASYSNYGRRSVDLAAPGSSILSTTPNNTYSYFSGTSMAAPHVTGLVSLMMIINPTLSLWDIKWMLRNTLEKRDFLKHKFIWGGFPDAYKLISEALGPTFFTPPGGWRQWRIAKTVIPPHSAARIPITFTATSSGFHRGTLIIRKMSKRQVIDVRQIDVEVEAVDQPNIDSDLLKKQGTISLRAYPSFPGTTEIVVGQRNSMEGSDSVNFQVSNVTVSTGDEGDGTIEVEGAGGEFTLAGDSESKNLTVTCSLKSESDRSETSKATHAWLEITGPVGLDSVMTPHRLNVNCQGVTIKSDPDELSVMEDDWQEVTWRKDVNIDFLLVHFADIDLSESECSGLEFEKYEIEKLELNSFMNLKNLIADYPVQEVKELQGQDDMHVAFEIKEFTSFPWFETLYDQNLTKVYISTNGLLAFSPWSTNNDWSPALAAPVRGEPTEVIGAYWSDLLSSPSVADSTIYVYDSPSMLIVQWNKMSQYGHPEADFTFQTVLTRRGDILLSYSRLNPRVTDGKKVNVGIKHGARSVSLTDVMEGENYMIQRKTKSTSDLIVTSGGGGLGVAAWKRNEESLSLMYKVMEDAESICPRLSAAIETLLYDSEAGVAFTRRKEIV